MGRERKPRRRLTDPGQSLHMPFERQPLVEGGPELDEMVTAGVVTMSGAVDIENVGVCPCLVFRFTRPDGAGTGFYPRVVLVLDPEDVPQLKANWSAALDACLEAVREVEDRA